jgi:ketosteroid isomerase-like protein
MRDAVDRYLACLTRAEWDALPGCLAPSVERIGPYGDVVTGRAPYAAFLRDTITALSGYVLDIDRVFEAGSTVVVELAETVDDGGGRLRTDEAVVFDIDDDGLIARVAVYVRSSVRS